MTEEKDEMMKRMEGKDEKKRQCVCVCLRDYLRTGSLVQSFRDEATI